MALDGYTTDDHSAEKILALVFCARLRFDVLLCGRCGGRAMTLVEGRHPRKWLYESRMWPVVSGELSLYVVLMSLEFNSYFTFVLCT